MRELPGLLLRIYHPSDLRVKSEYGSLLNSCLTWPSRPLLNSCHDCASVMVQDVATGLGLSVCAGVTVVLAVVSALGVFVGRDGDGSTSSGPKRGQGLIASLSAGVVLCVSWLHLLDDAQDTLKDLTDYPAANCAMLVGFLLMWLCQAQTRCHHGSGSPSSWGGEEMLLPIESAESCAAKTVFKTPSPPDSALLTRFHVMEASISFHSFLIGLGIGFAQSGWRAQLVLGGSLCVHQFFEGCAVGTVGKLCQLSKNAWLWTFVIFSLSLPSGVAIAIAAQLLATDGSNVGSQWTLGLLTACAAGQPHHALTGSLAASSPPLIPLAPPLRFYRALSLTATLNKDSLAIRVGRYAHAHRCGDDQPRVGRRQ